MRAREIEEITKEFVDMVGGQEGNGKYISTEYSNLSQRELLALLKKQIHELNTTYSNGKSNGALSAKLVYEVVNRICKSRNIPPISVKMLSNVNDFFFLASVFGQREIEVSLDSISKEHMTSAMFMKTLFHEIEHCETERLALGAYERSSQSKLEQGIGGMVLVSSYVKYLNSFSGKADKRSKKDEIEYLYSPEELFSNLAGERYIVDNSDPDFRIAPTNEAKHSGLAHADLKLVKKYFVKNFKKNLKDVKKLYNKTGGNYMIDDILTAGENVDADIMERYVLEELERLQKGGEKIMVAVRAPNLAFKPANLESKEKLNRAIHEEEATF